MLWHFRRYPPLPQWSFTSVCRISKHTFVKFGSGDSLLTEARNVDFVAAHTTIPIPRIHEVFRRQTGHVIVMDYVEGVELGIIWKKMTQEQQTQLLNELRGYVQQLRALVPPRPGAIEGVDGGSIEDTWLGTVGPYDDIAPFHELLGLGYIRSQREPS